MDLSAKNKWPLVLALDVLVYAGALLARVGNEHATASCSKPNPSLGSKTPVCGME